MVLNGSLNLIFKSGEPSEPLVLYHVFLSCTLAPRTSPPGDLSHPAADPLELPPHPGGRHQITGSVDTTGNILSDYRKTVLNVSLNLTFKYGVLYHVYFVPYMSRLYIFLWPGTKDTPVPKSPVAVATAAAVQWEPMSLSALGEYRPQRTALCRGAFNRGKVAVWDVTEQTAI